MNKFNVGDYCQFIENNFTRFWFAGYLSNFQVIIVGIHFYKNKNRKKLNRGSYVVSESSIEKVIKYKRLKPLIKKNIKYIDLTCKKSFKNV